MNKPKAQVNPEKSETGRRGGWIYERVVFFFQIFISPFVFYASTVATKNGFVSILATIGLVFVIPLL